MGRYDRSVLPSHFREKLTDGDLERNSTLQCFDKLTHQLERLDQSRHAIDTILDIGCVEGGFVTALGDYLDASDIYGIELNEAMCKRAQQRGVETFHLDVERHALPFDDDSVDLVIGFGVIEHLRYVDHLFEEIQRVLVDGWFWMATPNLGSWLNRLSLLAGFQPRNVELSSQRAAGILPHYKRQTPLDHVHAPTYKALIELLEHHGFAVVDSAGLTPYTVPGIAAHIDAILACRPHLARRVAVLAEQSNTP